MTPRLLPRRLQRLFVLLGCLALFVWLGACSDDAGQGTTQPIEYNSCGGEQELLFDGEPAQAGQACGECDDGVLICDGGDELVCEGASATNICGGCEQLDAEPDDACGACGDGAMACQDDGSIACEGATASNSCGGCAELDGEPGTECERNDAWSALWRCASPEEVRCVAPGENACGGTADLDTEPLEPCGECNLGVAVCDGQDAIQCEDEDAGVNACGGCAPLPGEPEESCGACGGQWVCAGEDDALCDDPQRNLCGGCTALAEGTPGEACEGGIWACQGQDALECTEEPTNACGGESSLDELPGEVCGPCGDGYVICASPNSTTCIDARELNACDGCSLTAGEPGDSCGPAAVWHCSEDGDLVCTSNEDLNACGGATTLDPAPGTACGPCELDTVVCDGTDATVCSGQTACPIPALTATQGDFTEHVQLSWAPLLDADEYIVYRDDQEIARVDADTTDYEDTGATAGSLPLAPADLQASQGDFTDRVELQWQPAALEDGESHSYTLVAVYPTATGEPSQPATGWRAASPITDYELSIDDGDWESIGVVTSYDDDTAPAATVVEPSAEASQGTEAAHVALSLAQPANIDTTNAAYRVRAVSDQGDGDPADEATGYRGAEAFDYQWERSADDSDADYTDLAGATSPGFDDDTAPADGTGRYYQLRISAVGADTIHTDAVRGFRAALPTLDTLAAQDITETSATLHADVTFLGAPDPTAHGFCYGTSTDPAHGDSGVTCTDLGALATTGGFSEAISGLSAGTQYFVRAFATTNAGTAYGQEAGFVTVSDAPTTVDATDGASTEHVTVSWDAATGADSYEIFRDGQSIGTTSQTSFEDTGAQAAPVPTQPTLTATQGTHNDRVALSWSGAQVDPGATHSYTVVAVNSGGTSQTSQSDDGWRGERAVTSYELQINGGTWTDIGLVTDYDDTSAPAGTIDAGSASASDGDFTTHVELSVSGVGTTDGASANYRVRALNDSGIGADSDPESGYRGIGSPSYQWERSAGDSDANYSSLSGATSASYDDTSAPADGSARYFRVVVSADGAPSATSSAARGFRAALPSLDTLAAQNVSETAATLQAQVNSLGAPEPTAHGFCYGTSANPTHGDSGVTCTDMGSLASAGSFAEAISGLSAGTQYFVRAFATNNAGTAYGQEASFVTVPPAPSTIDASDGTSGEYVTVSWGSVNGADSYEIFRDGISIGTTSQTSFEDTGAQAPPVPTEPTLTATQGTHTDRVELSWSGAQVGPGAPHTYAVVAVNSSGSSQDSPDDDGYRGARPISSYDVQINGGNWADVGLVTSYDDTSAPAGTIDAGTASASDGTSSTHVTISVMGESTSPGASVNYRVRAVNASGAGNESALADGYRSVGSMSYQWERSAGDSDGSYSTLSGATTPTYDDTSAPADGSARYYRVVISAAGATATASNSDRGYRATIANDPVLYFDFENGSGTVTNKAPSGANLWGTHYGSVGYDGEGRYGGYSLRSPGGSGSNDRLGVEGTISALDMSTGYTAMAWIKVQGGSGGQGIIAFGACCSPRQGYTLNYTGGELRFWGGSDSDDSNYNMYSGTLPTSTWVHVGVRGNQSVIELMVDGAVVDSIGTNVPTSPSLADDTNTSHAPNNPHIGGQGISTVTGSDILIDEVRVYDQYLGNADYNTAMQGN